MLTAFPVAAEGVEMVCPETVRFVSFTVVVVLQVTMALLVTEPGAVIPPPPVPQERFPEPSF
jgi:hypothetical protein